MYACMYFGFFETGSLYLAQTGLELAILLPLPPFLGSQAYASICGSSVLHSLSNIHILT
jgi:hypothetical protein